MAKTTMTVSENEEKAAPEAEGEAGQPQQTRVIWDDSNMATSFANVVNVLNTKEEFTLLFGQNKTWNLTESRELQVDLNNRIVLTPYAAKRLLGLLQDRVRD
jgi:hypothetical protein